ncbi:helix-turn-helix domain-containing protein [Bartonella sp. AU55XJBT]|uniref:helix-turn-helix domain-containing protein n=1 Tax=Bartonella sp. AU55XJBT TaxID=3019091 RepID=UPI002362C4AD|nr:helix-turn-helix transcriptional regulator [Bartonella sp. AU55XJBT]
MQTKNSQFQTKNPHFIDVLIGKRIRQRRIAMGLTQKTLGGFLGVSFQQIQKYEKGLNRVSASCLLEIATQLQVPISFFYADIVTADSISKDHHTHDDQYIYSEKEFSLLKNFRELTRKKQQAIWCLISD